MAFEGLMKKLIEIRTVEEHERAMRYITETLGPEIEPRIQLAVETYSEHDLIVEMRHLAADAFLKGAQAVREGAI